MKIQYRPDIDGLRAISVLGVIFYHLEFNYNGQKLLSGGFLGVDVFFVISGYLITKIIYKELILNNKISIISFYERRIRRIIPVLLVVTISFIIISFFLSLPTPLWKASESILASTFFIGNFYFLNESIAYGDNYSNLMPFLHTWSLGIEEQFYIIFPITLFLLHKYFNKKLFFILLVLFFLSFLAHHYTNNSWLPTLKASSFYMLPFRGWEILSGSILAVFETKCKKKNWFFNQYITTASFLIILFSFFFFKFEKLNPFPNLLLPVCSTLAIIWFSNKKNIVTKLLSFKPLVKIGLISFSLYLWHFPIFSLFRQIDIKSELFQNLNYKIVLLIVVFILSTISFKLIEQPFRDKKIISNKILFNSIISSLFFIVIFSITSINSKGFKDRFNNFYVNYNNYEIDNRFLKREWEKPLYSFYTKNAKDFTNSRKIKVLFIGNSHAVGYFNMFNMNQPLFKNYEFSMLRLGLQELKKYKFNEFQMADFIVLGKRYSLKMIENNSENEIEKFIDEWYYFLKQNNKKLVIILNRPEFRSNSQNNYSLLDEEIYNIIKKNEISNIDNLKTVMSQTYYNIKSEKVDYFNSQLIKVLNKKNIQFLNPKDYSCNEILKECEVLTKENHKIYWDYGHYTLDGAKYFGKKIFNSNWFNLKN